MNTSSHILMGRFLSEYVETHYKIRLERKSFILGNILPDYCPSFLIRPHFLKNNAVHVQNILRLLLSRRSSACYDKRYSRLLGIICHFYADFFCYAHSDCFSGSLSEHIAYENTLQRYFEKNLEQLSFIRFMTQMTPVTETGGLYRQFETLHAGYLLSHVSPGNDLTYAMMACIDFIVLISGAATAEEQTDSCRFDHLEAV
jgi:hypothetical protein